MIDDGETIKISFRIEKITAGYNVPIVCETIGIDTILKMKLFMVRLLLFHINKSDLVAW